MRSAPAAAATRESSRRLPPSRTLPRVSPLLLRWFTWYCRRYIRRHFHSLRISNSGLPPDTAGHSLVIYTNHASWWDPLVGLVIKDECFPERRLYAPIDADMLRRYQMFARLGFFGVAKDEQRGAVDFLRTGEAILQSPCHLLAITPQGRFADVRERPVRFQPGLGHLAKRAPHAVFLPMATEFVYWEERLPEILVRFGKPVEIRHGQAAAWNHHEWTHLFEQKLAAAQDALSVEAKRRDPADFECRLRGGCGQGGIYDWWHGWKARLRGEQFSREHGSK